LVKPIVPVILQSKVRGFVELFEKTEHIQRQAEQLRQMERREFEQRLAAENARLRESEARFRAIIESSFNAVVLIAADGTARYASPSLTRVLGYATDEFVGQNVFQGMHPDDLAKTTALFAQLVERPGATLSAEFRYRHTDGTWRWIDGSGTNLLAEPGVDAIVGIFQDITDRKVAEQALGRERELLQTIIDKIPVMITMYEPNAKVLRLNAAFEQTVGWSTRSAAGVSLMEECYPDPSYRGRVREFMQSCREGWLDIRMRTRDGRDIETSWANVRLSDSTQIGIGLDITKRKRVEQALKEADRRKDEFLATLAHELRNPLAPIRIAVQLLRMAGPLSPTAEEARDMIDRQVSQMVRLVDDLLDVSRITRGKLDLRKEQVDVTTVVQSALETARPLIERAGHALTATLPPEPVFLEADPVRLSQVIANLLTNAAKYTNAGGQIWLAVERLSDEVSVAVKDTGIGIAAEHLPRLFEMFSQVAPALERSQGGLGIGLALVKGLVEMHGGSVAASSAGLGKGSQFVVRLPVCVGTAPSKGVPPGNGEGVFPATKKKILVVDDNRDAADSLATMLRLLGHEIHATHDGLEAVEAAGAFRPDVVLLDIGLPTLNGYEAARRIREQPWGRQMVLVAISGWGQEEDKRRACQAGIDHHMTKPVTLADLERILAGIRH
jgi:PAS domain S-box-containing protein